MRETSPSRRRLLQWLTGGFLSIWGVGFAWVIGAFLKAPRARRDLAERVIKVGPLESLPRGKAQLVRHGREPILVVHTNDGDLIGLSAVCSHLRCILTWNESQGLLDCPCHNGSFDLNGNVLSGPPPRALRRFKVETQLGQIYVHL